MQNKKQDFIDGELYFTSKGEEVRLIGKVSNGDYLIEPVLCYETYDYDYEEPDNVELYGSPYTIGRLFHNPPIKKVDDEVKSLLAQKGELTAEIAKLKKTSKKLTKELDELERTRFDKYGENNVLRNLDAFLEGTITHYVILDRWEMPKIKPLPEHYGEEALLTLYGEHYGGNTLTWKANTRRSGSGDEYGVIPCISYEDAMVRVQEYLLKMGDNDNHSPDCMIEFANLHNLELPPNYIAKREQQLLEQHDSKIAKANKELAEAIKKRDDFISKTNLNIKEM